MKPFLRLSVFLAIGFAITCGAAGCNSKVMAVTPAVTSTVSPVVATPLATNMPSPTPSATMVWSPTPSETLTAIPTPLPTATGTPVPVVSPPAGIVFRTSDSLWIVNEQGNPELLFNGLPVKDYGIHICSTGAYAMVETETSGEKKYLAYEVSTGKTIELYPGQDQVFCYVDWWMGRCDAFFAAVQPSLEGGRECLGIPSILDLNNNLTMIGTTPSRFGGVAQPSSDGKLLAYSEQQHPWVYQWGVGSHQLITDSDVAPLVDYGFTRPTWSPDNSKVAWLVWGEIDGVWTEGIGIIDLKSNGYQFFYPYQVWSGEYPSYLVWNPREDYILLVTRDDSISVIALDGKEQFYIKHAMWGGWSWSPDGKWLTYALKKGKSYILYIRSTDGDELHELAIGEYPRWSPDSRYMIFEGQDETGYWIVEIGDWSPKRIQLPEDAEIVDWINPQ